jgi:hypothetical protein
MDLLSKRTQVILITVLSLALFSSCSKDKAFQGAGPKGANGDVARVLLDSQKSWRGGVIGGALGAVTISGVTEISTRASREAAREGKPVAYQSADGFQRIETHPIRQGSHPNCRLVREQIYQEGNLVRDEVREVCQ